MPRVCFIADPFGSESHYSVEHVNILKTVGAITKMLELIDLEVLLECGFIPNRIFFEAYGHEVVAVDDKGEIARGMVVATG